MKRLLMYFLVCPMIFPLCGQHLEIHGGLSRTGFYQGEIEALDRYSHRIGGCIGASIEDISKFKLRFTVKLDNYRVTFHSIGSSPARTYEIEEAIDKVVLAFGFYPFNFKLINSLRINIGGEYSYLIADKTTLGAVDITRDSNVGIISRVGYDVKIADAWYLVPQFLFYVGLTDEFKHITTIKQRSIRPYVEIGFKRVLD